MSKKIRKLKLGFDIDGVVCNFTHEFIRRLREKTNEHIPYAPIKYHYIDPYMDFFADEIGKGLFAECLPYATSEIYLNGLLNQDKYDIHFITARGTENDIYWTQNLKDIVKRDTKDWIKSYFPKFKMKNLHFSAKKDLLIRDLEIDSFVEDRKDTAELVAKVCHSFLITRSWNLGDLDIDCRRIESLLDFDYYLNGLLLKDFKKRWEL